MNYLDEYKETLGALDSFAAQATRQRGDLEAAHSKTLKAIELEAKDAAAAAAVLESEVQIALDQARAAVRAIDEDGALPARVRPKGESASEAAARSDVRASVAAVEATCRVISDHRVRSRQNRLDEAEERERLLAEQRRREAEERARLEAEERARAAAEEAARMTAAARRRALIMAGVAGAAIALVAVAGLTVWGAGGTAIGVVAAAAAFGGLYWWNAPRKR